MNTRRLTPAAPGSFTPNPDAGRIENSDGAAGPALVVNNDSATETDAGAIAGPEAHVRLVAAQDAFWDTAMRIDRLVRRIRIAAPDAAKEELIALVTAGTSALGMLEQAIERVNRGEPAELHLVKPDAPGGES